MVDYVIFGFGLFVTVVVGFGLATMIVTHNKAIESAAAAAELEPPATPDRPREAIAPLAKAGRGAQAARFGLILRKRPLARA